MKDSKNEEKIIYIDVESFDKCYKIIIYADGVVTRVKSKDMKKIAEYCRATIDSAYNIYIDTRGVGLYFADCLKQCNVPYLPLVHSQFVDIDRFICMEDEHE